MEVTSIGSVFQCSQAGRLKAVGRPYVTPGRRFVGSRRVAKFATLQIHHQGPRFLGSRRVAKFPTLQIYHHLGIIGFGPGRATFSLNFRCKYEQNPRDHN